jgi:hypothetical protein
MLCHRVRPILIGVCLLLLAAARGNGQVTSEYDATYNKTILQMERVPLGEGIQISLLATFPGRTLGPPENGYCVLTVWLDEPAALVDGRVPLVLRGDSLTWSGRGFPVPKPAPGYRQVLLSGMTPDTLRRLAMGAEPVLLVSGREYRVDSNVQEAILDYLDRFDPPEQ